jgi:hypothetical protein
MQRNLLGIINVDFVATGQLLIIYSAFVKYLRKIGIKCSSASAIYRPKKPVSDAREVLYKITI